MNSKPASDDLEFDLPTTEEDVAALRRARDLGRLSLRKAIETLSETSLPLGTPEQRRKTSEGWEPFSLE